MKLPAHRKAALRALLKIALPAIEAAPIEERADAYDGIAVACAGCDPQMAQAAKDAAVSIHETLSAQMTFRTLLS